MGVIEYCLSLFVTMLLMLLPKGDGSRWKM